MKIARCFAFVGPHLPLDAHFAIGNFIRDALHGGPIIVKSDGTPLRSYLYAADLAIWLWTILFNGKNCRAYNVGSDKEVSIAELADIVVQNSPGKVKVHIGKESVPGILPERYVPSVERAKAELCLSPQITPSEGIKRTFLFHFQGKNNK